MGRRRVHKRSRQNKFHEVQESLRKNVRRLFNSRNEDEETSDASHPRQRSPESVLFESQHADPLCTDKLSPEIILKQSRITRLEAEALKDEDSKMEAGVVAARMIKHPSPISSKCRELDLSDLYDFKHETKCINDFPNLEDFEEREQDAAKSIVGDPFDITESYSFSLSSLSNELNNKANGTVDVTRDGRSSANAINEVDACRNISGSAISRPNLKSQSRDNVCTFMNVPERRTSVNFDEKRSLEESSNQREDRYVFETMNDCYLLDKTLSMNDNLMREINDYLDEQSSAVVTSRSSKSKRVSEPAHFATSKTAERTEIAGSSVYRSIDGSDGKLRDNLDKRTRTSSDNKRFDVALEKIGERLTANWREFRKIFAYLRQVNRKIRDEDSAECSGSLLYKYRRFPYISVSTLSLPSSVLRTPSLSPRRVNSRKSPAKHDVQILERSGREMEKNGIPSESTTPRIGLVKRRRTTLTFGGVSEGEAAKYRKPATRVEITDPLPEGRKEEGRSFLLNASSCGETHQDSRISEPTIISDIDLFDCSRNESPQKIEYHRDDTRKYQPPQNVAALRDSRSHVPRRRNISRTIITWVTAICIWLIKKLMHLVNVSFKKLRKRLIVLPPSSPCTKKFDRLIETMCSENEMLYVMSEKVTRLSEDFVQIRTNTEATLNALTAEVNVFREASKKMTEDNIAMLQELKKLRETLEEVRLKSLQRNPSSSSCPSSSPRSPPPPPPPLCLGLPPPPPPPLPPVLFPPKAHISESASSMPPPLFPSGFFQSPMPSIQPTTPNSSKSNKNRTPRKCSTPLFNRPSITVEDLLKVTLRKAPQSIKENRRNTVPGPKGPVVSLEMLRNVKLKSAKRRHNDQVGRSPRNGRVVKNRTASSVNLSPILTGSEGNLERILRQVDLNRPRRLLSGSNSFRERDFARETQYQSLETLMHSQSQCALE